MKKIALLATSLVLSAALAGCGEQEASPQPQTAAETIDLQTEVNAYKEFAIEQMNQFVVETEKFVEAVKSGDIEEAKALYPHVRMYFERSEPIAESFGDLDPRIDARLADIQEAGSGEEGGSGYHKIEYGLWVETRQTVIKKPQINYWQIQKNFEHEWKQWKLHQA